MDDCIDSLGYSTVYSTIGANWGYCQMPIAKEGRDKTTFVTYRGAFRWIRIPFGLRNEAASFHQSLDVILSGVRFKSASCTLTTC